MPKHQHQSKSENQWIFNIQEHWIKMKISLILLSLVWSIQYTTCLNLEHEWKHFQEKFGKSYKSTIETKTRFAIFADNLKKIKDHNKRYENGEVSYKEGVNKFADWTAEEFLQYINLYQMTPDERVSIQHFKAEKNVSIPDSVDWRTKGCVTEVKDQGGCGSCWAFSTTGSMEGQLFLRKGKLISMSEQNLMDCSWGYENWGCSGGLMRSAFDYIRENGIESEADYPYEEFDGKCRFNKTKSVASISGYVTIIKEEDSLLVALSKFGPISIAMDATGNLKSYSSGILEDSSCKPYALNHGVLLVGYGSENGKNYYIIKNSWGAAWGEEGFFRLGNRGSNPCGIINDASYPLVI